VETFLWADALNHARAELMEREGCSLKPYKLEGKWHVGWGHLLREGDAVAPISLDRAATLFAADVGNALRDTTSIFSVHNHINSIRRSVIIQMAFQLGRGPKGLPNFREFIRAVKTENWPKAAAEIRDSLFYRQMRAYNSDRAEMLARLMEDGK